MLVFISHQGGIGGHFVPLISFIDEDSANSTLGLPTSINILNGVQRDLVENHKLQVRYCHGDWYGGLKEADVLKHYCPAFDDDGVIRNLPAERFFMLEESKQFQQKLLIS